MRDTGRGYGRRGGSAGSFTAGPAHAPDTLAIRALIFDVFGTVVDWRGSVIREGEELGREKGFELDWAAFADAWRARYKPSMDQVRRGERRWKRLMNRLYGCEGGRLFEWLRAVRKVVEEAEREKSGGRVA